MWAQYMDSSVGPKAYFIAAAFAFSATQAAAEAATPFDELLLAQPYTACTEQGDLDGITAKLEENGWKTINSTPDSVRRLLLALYLAMLSADANPAASPKPEHASLLKLPPNPVDWDRTTAQIFGAEQVLLSPGKGSSDLLRVWQTSESVACLYFGSEAPTDVAELIASLSDPVAPEIVEYAKSVPLPSWLGGEDNRMSEEAFVVADKAKLSELFDLHFDVGFAAHIRHPLNPDGNSP